MKNIFGAQEDLRLYYENGKVAYWFCKILNCYFREVTFDNQGNQTFCKNSSKYSWDSTFDNQGRVTSFKNYHGVSWKRIYKENGTFEQINL